MALDARTPPPEFHARDVLLDTPELSWRAKGLLLAILLQGPDWHLDVEALAAMSGDGRHRVRNGLDELERHGYLRRIPQRNAPWLHVASAQRQGVAHAD